MTKRKADQVSNTAPAAPTIIVTATNTRIRPYDVDVQMPVDMHAPISLPAKVTSGATRGR